MPSSFSSQKPACGLFCNSEVASTTGGQTKTWTQNLVNRSKDHLSNAFFVVAGKRGTPLILRFDNSSVAFYWTGGMRGARPFFAKRLGSTKATCVNPLNFPFSINLHLSSPRAPTEIGPTTSAAPKPYSDNNLASALIRANILIFLAFYKNYNLLYFYLHPF